MKNKMILLFVILIVVQFSAYSQNVSTVDELFEAIENASDGAKITLEKNTYTINQPIIISDLDGITIDGKGSTIILESTTENVFQITDCEGFIMKNIKATHTEPDGPLGCMGNVVYIQDCPGAIFKKCDLNGCGIVGIAAYNCDALLIDKCHIHKNSQYGIIYQGSMLEVKKTLFENNGHDNSIYYSYVEPGQYVSWPPDEEINTNLVREYLVLKKNTFK